MTLSVRSCLTNGIAAVTAVTIAATSSVPEPARHPTSAPVAQVAQVRVVQQPVQLAAAVQNTAAASATALPNLLTDWFRDLVPSASATFPTPQFPPAVVGNSLSSGIKNIYNAIEPWVQWGFEVATYAVGWIPWVGYLAPQIMIFYNLGERIVRSITFNIADWIGGSVSFVQGLRNVAVDTINSFIYFANDELAFWLPPLPPFPPIGGGLSTATAAPSLKLAGALAPVADSTTAGTITGVPETAPLKHEETTPSAVPVIDLETLPLTEPDPVLPEPEAPAVTPLEPVSTPEPEPKEESETLGLDLKDEDLEADDLKDDLKDDDLKDDLKDGEKDVQVDPKPEADAEKDSDLKKPEPEKVDAKNDTESDSGSEA